MLSFAVLMTAGMVGCSGNSNSNGGDGGNGSGSAAANNGGGSAAAANGAGSTNAGNAAEPAPADKTYEIKYHGSFQLDGMKQDSDVEQAIEKKFNVKIDLVNAKMDKINLLAASNDLPDIIRIADPKDVATLASSGMLLELPESLLQEQMPDVINSLNQVDQGLWGLTKVDGKNYAIPQYLTVVPWDSAMTFRKDILDAAGIADVPATIDQYDAAFKAIKADEKAIAATTSPGVKKLYMFGGADMQYGWNAWSWLFGAYGSMPDTWQLDANGNVARGETLPGTKDALAKLREWYAAGYIDPAFVTDKGDQYGAKYNTGTYVMGTRGLNQISSPNTDDLQKNIPTVQYVNAKSPVGPNGDAGVWSWGKRQNFVGISAKLKDDPDKVKKILSMLNTIATDEELYKLTHWGIEGKSYKLTDGIPVAIQPYDNDKSPETAALGVGSMDGQGGSLFGPFGNIDLVKKYMDPKLVEATNQYYTGKPDVIFMLPLPSTATTEQRIIDKWNETFTKIVIGEAPLSAYDDFLKWFKDNGGEQLTKEANDLYAANFKS